MPRRALIVSLVALALAFAQAPVAGEGTLEAAIGSATGIPRSVSVELVSLAQKRAVEASAVPDHRYLQELSDSGAWSSWGEVLAWGYETNDSVIAAWLVSPGHAEILLDKSYDSIGCGSYYGGGRLTIACILADYRDVVPPLEPAQDSPGPAPASPLEPSEIPDTAMR